MVWRTWAWLALVALITGGQLGIRPADAAEVGAADAEASARLDGAALTQWATRARLGLLEGGHTCAQAGFVAYRRSDAEPDVADEWYVASQLWADAALLAAARGPTGASGPATRASAPRPPTWWSAPEARCHLDKGFLFLDRLWDSRTGGYYPRFDLTTSRVDRETRYTDDNALTGLALLAAAETAPDQAARGRYLASASREAGFLVGSGLWDHTFGGGFWWTMDKGDTEEGKPAQTNALAALFFGRLYEATRVTVHREWALRTLAWMDAALYDPAHKLYRWGVRYQDPERRAGPAIWSDRYFNYDQGIAIEAQIVAARLDGDARRLARARGIGQALHTGFWSRDGRGYNLQLGVEQVFTSYASWASLGHLALHDLDRDPGWLDMARAHADALRVTLGESDGSYAYRHYQCVDTHAPGCEAGGFPWVVDRTSDTSAQAWMQQLQTGLARRSRN